MTALAFVVGGFVTLVLLAIFKNLVMALLVQEVKGALAERLQRDVGTAASLIPDDEIRTQMQAEWLGELAAASDRPFKATLIVRGFKAAAKQIAADTVPVPAGEAGPTFVERVQHAPGLNMGKPSLFICWRTPQLGRD